MDSDDDYQSFSPPKEPSPQVHYQRLKRLKKSNLENLKSPSSKSIGDPLLFSSVDFAKSEALVNDSETLDFNDSNSGDLNYSPQESLSQIFGSDNEEDKDDEMGFGLGEEVKITKRVLEFDDEVIPGVGIGGENLDFENGKKRSEEHLNLDIDKGDMTREQLIAKKENKKKKKRLKSDSDDELKVKERPLTKRREEKERQSNLKEIHAETQRLLRETRDAAFKPIPVVKKPISSVLEKIRKRTLEISKKAISRNKKSDKCEENMTLRDDNMDLDSTNEEMSDKKMAEAVEKESVATCDDEKNIGDLSVDECKGPVEQSHENDQEQVSEDEKATPAFRPPVDDTQDLFDDSEPNVTSAKQLNELNSPLEEDFAPSLPALNLTLDSAPIDDSSDEENNDKENIDPRPRRNAYGSSSPKGDPVRNFIDVEAEEEDDSDNDLTRFKENEEDEDIEDFEELNDMIATGYEERPVDKEMRDELHQKWLEQQDAVGTDNLLQRFKCGSELRETVLLEEEPESHYNENDDDGETKDDNMPKNSNKLNIKKAKQLILQMFSEKEDAYISDEDEDTHRRRVHHFIQKEEQTTLVSPADDENSREVFGLIKKLNIVSDNKKKPKPSLFDSILGNSNSSSRSSFLGRSSSLSIPSSHKKQGSTTFRSSFIFGRDDSNSRSSISISEDSADAMQIPEEVRPTRNTTVKFSKSQTKFNDQNRDASEESASRTSLFEILKRPRTISQVCHEENTVDLTKSIFAFKGSKKAVKMEGRS